MLTFEKLGYTSSATVNASIYFYFYFNRC